MLSGFLWWVGLLVSIVLTRKLILALISRHKSLCFWTSSINDAMAPFTTGGHTSFPWIVVNIPKRNMTMESVIGKIAGRWPYNPILILVSEKMKSPAGDELRSLTVDENNSTRKCEIMKIDYSGNDNVSALGDIFRDRIVGLVLSCIEPNAQTKASDHWTSDEIKNEIWTTFRHHTIVSRLCLPKMIDRNAGAIVSLCSEIPELNNITQDGPRSVQSAVANGVMVFSQAMQTECRSKNILVQTWLYNNRFHELAALFPAILKNLQAYDKIELFSERCLSCLETGSTSWIFPLGYTPSIIRPLMRQELMTVISEFIPSQLLVALKHSTIPVLA